MAQIKIFGLDNVLSTHAAALSEAIHAAVIEALAYPPEKKFHRFIGLQDWAFIYPDDRSCNYTIIEIAMFEGRSVDSKKTLVRLLFENIQAQVGIEPQDVEITITETPRHNWGIRGKCGDELALGYSVEI
jgi:4-oxalocrotonate tautomerase family enzyme